jgi:hypothetical protein
VQERWPRLVQSEWSDTQATLHRWVQIVGKIRLRQEPLVNHWWNVTPYVTARGLTTSIMPYANGRSFQIEFDFLQHRLLVDGCDGEKAEFPLEPVTVADFYARLMAALYRTRRASTKIRHTARTTKARSSVCFARCFRRTASARCFAHVSSARRVRCMSSGVRWIWR